MRNPLYLLQSSYIKPLKVLFPTFLIPNIIATFYANYIVTTQPKERASHSGASNLRIFPTILYQNTVLGSAGGFLVGWPAGTSLAGGDPNWTLAAIGAGLIVISIPFTLAYTKHAKNSVRIYNSGLSRSSFQSRDFSIGLTSDGIGLKVTF